MVGVLSAQSLVLSSLAFPPLVLYPFLYAGVTFKKFISGLPRLLPILYLEPHVQPAMRIFLKEEYSHDNQKAKDVLQQIEHVTFRDVIIATEIYHDPGRTTCVEEDVEFVTLFYDMMDEEVELSPWVLRVEFDCKWMDEHHVLLSDVAQLIACAQFEIMWSSDFESKRIMRIYVINGKETALEVLKELEFRLLNEETIKGIKVEWKWRKREEHGNHCANWHTGFSVLPLSPFSLYLNSFLLSRNCLGN